MRRSLQCALVGLGLPFLLTGACGGDDGDASNEAAGSAGASGVGGEGVSGGRAGASGEGVSGGRAGAGGEGVSGGGAGGEGGIAGKSGAAGAGGGKAGAGGSGPVDVRIAGLTAPVTATYDPYGMLHLACQSDADCVAAMGYFHAANRFFFMDFLRNYVRGTLGSLVRAGAQVIDGADVPNRQFFSTPAGEPLEDLVFTQADDDTKALLTAYTGGVNAWLADMRAGRNGATLTTEYDFFLVVKDNIRDWQPQDSTAVALYMLNDLSNNGDDEVADGTATAALPPDVAADLLSLRPAFDAFVVPEATGTAPPATGAPALFAGDALRGRLGAFGRLLQSASARSLFPNGARRSRSTGSNNWVLAPSRTKNGRALLCNDPHLQLLNPSIWFPLEVDAKSGGGKGTLHMEGGGFAGLPAVLSGHNESIAWGDTVAYYDMTDVYDETETADGTGVVFEGKNVPFVTKQVMFADASTGTPVARTLKWVPHHGPVISEDVVNKKAVTMRWVGHGGSTDMQAFLKLNRAASVDEAKTALSDATTANQNIVVADAQGHIGWFPYSKVPNRPWASPALPPWLPLPGDGTAEWSGFVPLASLPQLVDPPKGFIATANADATGASLDGDPLNDGVAALQASSKADGTREQRIVDLLDKGGDQHTVDTMHDLQGDTYSLLASVIVPALIDVAANRPDLPAKAQPVVDSLKGWDYVCQTGLDGSDPKASAKSADATRAAESIGCAAFHVTLMNLIHDAMDDEYKAAGLKTTVEVRQGVDFVVAALTRPDTLVSGDKVWDDVTTPAIVETRDDIFVRALGEAADRLATLSASRDDWRWGRIHTATLASVFDSFGFTMYNDGPYATPGGLFTVNVGDPKGLDLDYSQASGSSLRTVIELMPGGPTMRFELPGGEDLHRDSPFYDNLLPMWLDNQSFEFPFGPGAVTKPAKVVEVNPAK